MDKQELKVTRKAYSSHVKFQAVMEVIKGKAVGEVARLYEFHPTLFPRWKRQFEEKDPGIFEDKKN